MRRLERAILLVHRHGTFVGSLHYIELNPVCVGVVAAADLYRWFQEQADAVREPDPPRANMQTDHPVGAPEFVKSLQHTLHQSLSLWKGRRPRNTRTEADHGAFGFV